MKVNDFQTKVRSNSVTTTGSTLSLDFSVSKTHIVTLAHNITLSVSDIELADDYCLVFKQGATPYTVTYPSEFVNVDNISSTANSTTIIDLKAVATDELQQKNKYVSGTTEATTYKWSDLTDATIVKSGWWISYNDALYICNTQHTRTSSFVSANFDPQNSAETLQTNEWTASTSQVDFVISGASVNEIGSVDDVFIEGIAQPTTAYSIETTTVTNDTLRIYPDTGEELNGGEVVVLQYYRG